MGVPLVVQWLKVPLPMQRIQVRSLLREDPICCGATKPMCCLLSPHALQPALHNGTAIRSQRTIARE